MPLVILNIIGWIAAHWRVLVYIVAAIALVIVFGLVYRSCNKPPKLDEKAIQSAQQAIEKQDRKVMVDILANSDAQEKVIDQNVANAKADTINAKEESKKKWSEATNDELAKELEARSH